MNDQKFLILFFAMMLISLISCGGDQSVSNRTGMGNGSSMGHGSGMGPMMGDSITPENLQDAESPGAIVYKQKCAMCHSINPPPTAAPPFRGVITTYIQSGDNRDEFITNVIAYVHKPDPKKSRLPQAIDRFGLMPEFGYPDSEVESVAEWLWDSVRPAMGIAQP